MEAQLPALENYVSSIERKLTTLETEVTSAFTNVKHEFDSIKKSLRSSSSSGMFNAVSSTAVDPTLLRRLELVEKSLNSVVMGDTKQVAHYLLKSNRPPLKIFHNGGVPLTSKN